MKDFDFSSKFVLITGAGSGIGRKTSVFLSQLGAKLLLIDINQESLAKTRELCQGDAFLLPYDLSNLSGLKTELESKIKEHGKLDAMVHIAGIPCVQPLKLLKYETVEKVMTINATAALELSRIFSSAKNNNGENSAIVYISSVYGLVGSAANVAYSMSKSALHGITKSLAIELASKKIRVNCIAPGFIKTEMLDDVSKAFDEDYDNRVAALHPLGLGEAQDIANAISFLISDMSKWITGSIISVDGGFTAQ
ncbi:SDR family NAD(P)-dependent oxidoreductase [Flavobacterium covae]|uniref:SDR family NAD(P)-dependent oxidoreductase n=1 Tax=Flavobacterium covae TaxID=2906076 RepID=UPI000B5BF822|nr:SDR family NAD(P)-dependent oxidoreductase [Flavobacterium covae]MCJ1805904.1 SDR family oxidoreductase [Flavobacterium covae]OXA80184.1 short-chain dehydrogenase [Flavobacterium columnare] [Flavobacterium columnare NBRC 100251 = ATCC 23463]